MKSLFTIFAVLFTYSAAAQTKDHHPSIHQMVGDADVIAVAKLREPQLWVTSELTVMTGLSTALVERTLKGKELPSKISVQVVRYLDVEHLSLERPQVPNKAEGFPTTPATPTEFVSTDDTSDLANAVKVIVFLRRSENGDLSAADGFLYTLPYSPELAAIVSSAVKTQAQQDGGGQPATRPESKPEDNQKPQSKSEGRSR